MAAAQTAHPENREEPFFVQAPEEITIFTT